MPNSSFESELDIDHLAKLVADGEVNFPSDLSPEHELQLVDSIRILQRRKTVSFIARQIADAMHVTRNKRGDRT